MPVTAQGYVTVTDVTDGAPTIAVIQGNENHTFPSDNLGLVDSALYLNPLTIAAAYRNEIVVLNGVTQLTHTTGVVGADQYKITINKINGVTPTNVATDGIVCAIENVTGKAKIDGSGTTTIGQLKVTDMSTSVTKKSFIITLQIDVMRLGQIVTLYTNTTITKALGGTAHSITVTASRQNFMFEDAFATSPLATAGTLNTDITINAIYNGPDTSNIVFQKNINGDGTTWVAQTSTTSPTNATATITRADFPASQQFMTIKVSKAGVEDKVSIIRTDRGQANFYIVPEVVAGTLTLKNNTGSATVVARVFKGGVEVTPLTGWTFDWKNNGVSVPNDTTNYVISNNDSGTNARIVIKAAAVPDNGALTLSVTGTGP